MNRLLKKFLNRPLHYSLTSLFIAFILIVILYIISYRLIQEKQSDYNWFEEQVASFSSSSFVKSIYAVSDFWDILKFSIFTKGNEIRDLKASYKQLKNAYLLLKQENNHLSKIVHYIPKTQKIVATARILGNTNTIASGVYTLSAGKENGVQFKDIVITSQGLVGKIVKTNDHTSIMLPVRHLSAKTIGHVKHQGSMALISGRHLKGGIIDYISDITNLEKGQEIISISDGQSMPSGIKIGTIIDPNARPIRVKLSVDFAKLDYVTITRSINAYDDAFLIKAKD